MELIQFLDMVRVVCLLVIVICQVVIAHSLWVFSRHGVVGFSTHQMAMLMGTSAAILAVATVLTVAKHIDNAVRLTERLLTRKLVGYEFIDESGFYKVRIGNFSSREEAVAKAEGLKSGRVIEDYFIIAPGDYAAARPEGASAGQLRKEIVRTAERFIGVPYKWVGESTVSGFDCSGLTMVVYQLNGLELPRTSGDQWAAGRPVNERDLSQGDLLFFATRGGNKVSHVGIYLGGDTFLHASGRGNTIQGLLYPATTFERDTSAPGPISETTNLQP